MNAYNSASLYEPPRLATIIDAIREQVVNKVLQQGDRLPSEAELANRFNVSRDTIKEAVKFLINYDLLEVGSDDNVLVRKGQDSVATYLEKNRVALRDHLEVHFMLETQIVRLASHRRTLDDIHKLWFALARRGEYDINDDLSNFVDRALAVHQALAVASHNAVLQSAYHSLNTSFRKPYLSIFADNELFAPGLAAHARVIEAINYGDERAAVSAVRALFLPLLEKLASLSSGSHTHKTDLQIIS